MNVNLSNVMDQAQQDPYIYIHHCKGKKTEQVFSVYQKQACMSSNLIPHSRQLNMFNYGIKLYGR